ncbi:hypothetical protein INP83_09095 [Mucilaginibacter sp. 21P]|uniref:hypothetical protein n=1 Tax=Mucilaginibacter sp. 21P TaxID=2778902 RepID=UPI001C5A3C24|nr:hypothetical protein [Mucilaginibacter sp. 21P]QXV67223.1 hypothetical protein INP83_09095 [Mucilaginibacter sp. 21P]
MKRRTYKHAVAALFLGIFVVKMFISIAPVYLSLDNKHVRAVIMQLEHETKNEKEDPEKDAFKEKKAFDENFVYLNIYRPIVLENNILHSQERSLYQQVYHPVVPTPPPNA